MLVCHGLSANVGLRLLQSHNDLFKSAFFICPTNHKTPGYVLNEFNFYFISIIIIIVCVFVLLQNTAVKWIENLKN